MAQETFENGVGFIFNFYNGKSLPHVPSLVSCMLSPTDHVCSIISGFHCLLLKTTLLNFLSVSQCVSSGQ